MRFFSVILSLLAIMELLFPQIAIADQAKVEKVNTKNQNQKEKNIKIPYNYPNYQPLKILSDEEIKRNLIIARRAQRQNIGRYKPITHKKFIINASAYTAAADECGKSDGITASGVKVKEKRTLACPPQYAFGTKIKIEGMGIYVCEDRGGAIKGNHFDIYMLTKQQAFSFGRRHLQAEVVG